MGFIGGGPTRDTLRHDRIRDSKRNGKKLLAFRSYDLCGPGTRPSVTVPGLRGPTRGRYQGIAGGSGTMHSGTSFFGLPTSAGTA